MEHSKINKFCITSCVEVKDFMYVYVETNILTKN